MSSQGMLRRSLAASQHSNAPISYEVQLPNADAEPTTATLVNTIGGITEKRKIPVFTGYSVEEWCNMDQAFTTVMNDWNITTGPPKFKYYAQCLQKDARQVWDASTAALNAAQRTHPRWETERAKLIENYSGRYPRPKTLHYLRSPAVKKRHDADVRRHHGRMKTLFAFHDLLPGDTPTILDNEDVRKELVMGSFPERWQGDFALHKGQYAADTIQELDIVDYMVEKKIESDRNEAIKQRSHPHKKKGPPSRNGNPSRYSGGFRPSSTFSPYPSSFNNRGYSRSGGFQNRGSSYRGNRSFGNNRHNNGNNNNNNRQPSNSYRNQSSSNQQRPPQQNQQQQSYFLDADGQIPDGDSSERASAEMHNAEMHFNTELCDHERQAEQHHHHYYYNGPPEPESHHYDDLQHDDEPHHYDSFHYEDYHEDYDPRY